MARLAGDCSNAGCSHRFLETTAAQCSVSDGAGILLRKKPVAGLEGATSNSYPQAHDYAPGGQPAPSEALCAVRYIKLAEEQGFEPWEDFHPRRFSRPVHSTTLPLLRHGQQ